MGGGGGGGGSGSNTPTRRGTDKIEIIQELLGIVDRSSQQMRIKDMWLSELGHGHGHSYLANRNTPRNVPLIEDSPRNVPLIENNPRNVPLIENGPIVQNDQRNVSQKLLLCDVQSDYGGKGEAKSERKLVRGVSLTVVVRGDAEGGEGEEGAEGEEGEQGEQGEQGRKDNVGGKTEETEETGETGHDGQEGQEGDGGDGGDGGEDKVTANSSGSGRSSSRNSARNVKFSPTFSAYNADGSKIVSSCSSSDRLLTDSGNSSKSSCSSSGSGSRLITDRSSRGGNNGSSGGFGRLPVVPSTAPACFLPTNPTTTACSSDTSCVPQSAGIPTGTLGGASRCSDGLTETILHGYMISSDMSEMGSGRGGEDEREVKMKREEGEVNEGGEREGEGIEKGKEKGGEKGGEDGEERDGSGERKEGGEDRVIDEEKTFSLLYCNSYDSGSDIRSEGARSEGYDHYNYGDVTDDDAGMSDSDG